MSRRRITTKYLCLISLLLGACDCDTVTRPPLEDAATDAVIDAGETDARDATLPETPCPEIACNTATRDASGVCVYTAAFEREACDDGNACTSTDVCVAGTCTGAPITQPSAVRGSVTTFGGEPAYSFMEGTVAFVADERLVFLESDSMSRGRLSLVAASATGLTRLATATTRVAYRYHSRSVIYWGEEDATFIVPLDAHRFAVVGSGPFTPSGIEVWSHEGDTLVSLGFTRLALATDRPAADAWITSRGAAGRGDVLYVCGDTNFGRRLRAYVLGEDGTYTKVTDLATPSGGCNELALSPDGTRLYVAAVGGYRIYDVTTPATFAVPSTGPHVVLTPQRFVEDIEVGPAHVVVHTAREVGEIADAEVLDLAGTSLGTIPRPRAEGPRATPYGIAIAGDRLVVTWLTSAERRYSVATHALSEEGFPLIAEHTVREGSLFDRSTAVAPVARGDFAVARPYMLGFHLGETSLTPLTGMHHGSMRNVVARGEHEAMAFGLLSAHRVDLTDPDAPLLLESGMRLAPKVADFLLADTGLFEPRTRGWDSVEHRADEEPVTLVDVSSFPPTRLAHTRLSQERRTVIATSGGAVLSLAEADAGYRVRRFERAHVPSDEGSAWPSSLDVTVPAPEVPGYVLGSPMALGVAPDGREMLVLASIRTVTTPSVLRFQLLWLRRTETGLQTIAHADFPTAELPYAIQVLVEGDDAVLVGNDLVARVHREGTAITRTALFKRMGADDIVKRLVHADADVLVLSVHSWEGPDEDRHHGYELVVLDRETLTHRDSYAVPDDVWSLAVQANRWLVGGNTSLTVIEPRCGD